MSLRCTNGKRTEHSTRVIRMKDKFDLYKWLLPLGFIFWFPVMSLVANSVTKFIIGFTSILLLVWVILKEMVRNKKYGNMYILTCILGFIISYLWVTFN